MFRRIFSLSAAMLTGLCAFGDRVPPAATKQPKGFFKVLTLGHSLTVDSCHMLALVAKAEGYEGLHVGTLYDSGTPLYRHVDYLQRDAKAYSLYYSKTDDAGSPPKVTDHVSMKEALQFMDWDLIVMQGGTFTIADPATFTNGNIRIIQNYVNAHKLNPNAVFAWHMPWAFATDPELQAMYPRPDPNNHYINGYKAFDDDRLKLYAAITARVREYILTDETFRFLIPTGTAIENAMSGYLTEKDLLRDYAHATDYGRLIAAYTWYCCLMGIDHLENVQLTTVPVRFLRSKPSTADWQLTEAEKLVLIESVNHALKNPLEVTRSQYTEAP